MSTGVSSKPEIERLEAPSREEFDRRVRANLPVILTGVSPKWPAYRWDVQHLRAVAGDSIVTVHYRADGNFHSWYGSTKPEDVRMPLREFIDILLRDPWDGRYYMTEHELALISPRLVEDIDASKYVGTKPFLFLGRDTHMPCHYHGTTEAILCQLKGTKQITLFAPDQWPRLYAHPWYTTRYYFSRVDTRKPDLARFPTFTDAVPLSSTLHPGEILSSPVHWWHVTTCPGVQISTTLFWPSQRERYRFPTPGLQVYAHQIWRQLGIKPAHALKRRLRSLVRH
jgi:hypothetical protein